MINQRTLGKMDATPDRLDVIFQVASTRVNALLRSVSHGEVPSELVARVEHALAALPLPWDQFGVIKCRLYNALRYCHLGEMGAASYELRLLYQSVSSRSTAEQHNAKSDIQSLVTQGDVNHEN